MPFPAAGAVVGEPSASTKVFPPPSVLGPWSGVSAGIVVGVGGRGGRRLRGDDGFFEMGFFETMGVYDRVPRSEQRETGGKIIGTQWIDS